jgi:hypothetical protein
LRVIFVVGVLSLPPLAIRTSVRLSTLKHRREWLAGAVVATDSLSVNADQDNGAATSY